MSSDSNCFRPQARLRIALQWPIAIGKTTYQITCIATRIRPARRKLESEDILKALQALKPMFANQQSKIGSRKNYFGVSSAMVVRRPLQTLITEPGSLVRPTSPPTIENAIVIKIIRSKTYSTITWPF